MAHPSAGLPARDFQEIRLAEALEQGRCPMCDARQEAAFAALRGLAREGATDRGLRAQMDKGLGFCAPHSLGLSKMEILQTSSQLATAVLLDAVLRRRLAAFEKLARADVNGQQRAIGELADSRCPVCARMAEASRSTADRLLRLSADPGWAAALGGAELCLDDLLSLWAAAVDFRDAAVRWSAILVAQRRRLAELQKTLAEYAHNSTSDRRHLITAEQQRAAATAIRFFSGSSDRDRNR
jgi:hypothetical protein